MRANSTKSAVLIALAAGLSACAQPGGTYPSLAMRPFESGVAPREPAPPPPANRPATSPERIAAFLADAAAAHRIFTAREAEAVRLARAAAGQSVESEARAAAIIALADLDAQRARTAGTLAAIDSLAAEAGNALAPDPSLTAAQTEIAALLAREDAGIARLWDVMGS
jgi:hypothetical protein